MIKNNYIYKILNGEECESAPARIFMSALEEFAMLSPSAARTRHIAMNANVNHAAISYYFKTKEDLYLEVIRQVSEFLNHKNQKFYKIAEDIYLSKNKKLAKKLICDFFMDRVNSHLKTTDSNKKILKHIVSIIIKEDIYPTKASEIFYKTVYKKSQDMVTKLVLISSETKYSVETARIISEMLWGQVRIFCSGHRAFSFLDWKSLTEKESNKIRKTFNEILEKI